MARWGIPAPAADRELVLMIPGLFGGEALGGQRRALEGLAPWALGRALGRATPHRRARLSMEAALFDLFGLPVEAEASLPIAPVTLVHDGGVAGDAYWLRADPVRVRVGQESVIMVGTGGLDVGPDEAEALCASLNAHFAGQGLRLHARTPDRWYLRLEEPPPVRFSPLYEVLGNDLHPHMPDGAGARAWRAWINEAQMLLHASTVNRQRRMSGRPEINSLWFWGGGCLPAPGRCGVVWTWSDDALAAGLARHAQIGWSPLPSGASEWFGADPVAGRHLVIFDRLREPVRFRDVEGWRECLRELDETWIAPLLAALRSGDLARLVVCPADLCAADVSPGAGLDYHVTSRTLRRWWRRSRCPA